VTKRADASSLAVVNRVKAALPRMQELIPEDIKISFEFDQSTYVKNSLRGLVTEGVLGALLTGAMVLLFLRDVRRTLIVVVTIPFALLAAVVGLWLTGQTVNMMTRGGLAPAIGILVDEATVGIENIHTHLARGEPRVRAVLEAARETAVPRLLAMLSSLAVFVPSFFMTGITGALFVALSSEPVNHKIPSTPRILGRVLKRSRPTCHEKWPQNDPSVPLNNPFLVR
jgi:multidrug efflux pump subunit AcrB